MSKKQKSKNHVFIPQKLSGRVFTSLGDLGRALGLNETEQPTPRAMNCRKCGTPMRNISGTNVWLCDGMVEKEVDGNTKLVPCGNRAMTSVSPRHQNSENAGKPRYQGKPAQATIS